MVIRRFSKFFSRRRSQPAAPVARPAPAVATPPRTTGRELVTWESELRAIAAEAAAWSVETGGDLFGRWQDTPTVFLATKAGPNATRDNAHFRLDVEYLRKLSEPLAKQWALRYFGDWHSHHRLGLKRPSGGDRRRIRQLGARNHFPAMAEIIVTTEGSERNPTVRIHPWHYTLADGSDEPTAMAVKVLPGLSPIRQALIARSEFPEQELRAWESVPLDRVRIGDEREPPRVVAQSEEDRPTRDRILSHLKDALKQASGAPVEQHTTAFGHILVAELQEPHHLAFAIDAKWPMNVLEVHRLNRRAGTADPVAMKGDLVALDPAGVVEAFRAAKVEGVA